jgi:tRNA(fMet)-specific endonuclease VapC
VFVLDSDILSLYHHGHERIQSRLSSCAASEVAVTIVSHAEIMKARYEYLLKAANRAELQIAQQWIENSIGLLSSLQTLKLDDLAIDQFETLLQMRGFRRIGRADILIASIVLAHDATLVTRNVRDFSRIPRLRYENWAA